MLLDPAKIKSIADQMRINIIYAYFFVKSKYAGDGSGDDEDSISDPPKLYHHPSSYYSDQHEETAAPLSSDVDEIEEEEEEEDEDSNLYLCEKCGERTYYTNL